MTANAGLPLDVQAGIRAATFEVVLKKPASDPLTYEKPLPMDLLPYLERNDNYRSIGTAFALGHNQYVSAAHVFGLAIDSQFGAPALRSADGVVYSIDRILKFSLHGDFVVFSLTKDPAPKALPTNREAKIDTAVFAVGDALGEGIVIRDGVYTSETPEEKDGLWKWIRFSAAASPGNSGGPLLDDTGQVLGIVLRKSANENLNYSLPIGIVLDAPADKAQFEQRELTALPLQRGTSTYEYREQFPLPLTWPEFARKAGDVVANHFNDALVALRKAHPESLFISGVGVDSLLYARENNAFDPRLVTQQSDDTWATQGVDAAVVNLPDDGFVSSGWVNGISLLRLHRSKDASDDAFYADSKTFMDVALKSLALDREVGHDRIRITSLNAAQTQSTYTDQFTRVWQERIWAMPYRDAYLVGYLLPTPDGYAAIIQIVPSAVLRETQAIMRHTADHFSVSYAGTPSQWQAFLKRSLLLPRVLSDVTLTQKPDWQLHTHRFEFRIINKLFPISDQGQVELMMGFVQENSQLAWDAVGVSWTQDADGKSMIGVFRVPRPPKSSKQDLRAAYADIAARRPPYDGDLLRDGPDSYGMSKVMSVPGSRNGKSSADLFYCVLVRLSGQHAYQDVTQVMSLASDNTRILEHGLGQDTDATPQVSAATGSGWHTSSAEYRALAGGSADAMFGQDTRGRKISQDFRDFVLSPSDNHAESVNPTNIATALFSYWKKAAGVVNNRDLWPAYLQKNDLPATTGHDVSVLEAQTSFAKLLESTVPGLDWSTQATALIGAYVKEREQISRSRGKLLPAVYIARKLSCPKPAERRSGTDKPTLALLTRSPTEFYPNASRRAQIEGAVVVAVQVDSDGCGRQKGIVASSGSDEIDLAAMDFIDTAEFFPAESHGAAVVGVYKTVIRFELNN